MSGAGPLDQRVEIQTNTRTPDGGGGHVAGWTEVATVWASVKPERGQEDEAAGQVRSTAMYKVRIRNRVVSAAMRLVWRSNGDTVLNIRQVPDPGSRAMYIDLVAESGVPT